VALAYGIHPLTGEASPAGRWRVRNVVVHGRPNPPVGALGDKYRPACSYWAVACVNRRWFDLDAVRTPASGYERPNGAVRAVAPGQRAKACLDTTSEAGAPPLDWFEDECDQFERDLWTIPTFGYKGAHYATFAPELVRRFIVSMCPARVCRECGKPSARITGPTTYRPDKTHRTRALHMGEGIRVAEGVNQFAGAGANTSCVAERQTLGWTDCGHGGNWRPGVVLDPFGGTGTTGMVAAGNGRDALLLDLDGRNLDLARERIGMFLTEPESA
jgi:site-specific DNA-methyltransferase (adenine-specific)